MSKSIGEAILGSSRCDCVWARCPCPEGPCGFQNMYHIARWLEAHEEAQNESVAVSAHHAACRVYDARLDAEMEEERLRKYP